MTRTDYEHELTAGRADVAAVLRAVADGVTAGTVRVGEGDGAVAVDAPEELSLEVELEVGDGEVSLELELEWPIADEDGDGDRGADADRAADPPVSPLDDPPGTGEDAPAPVGPAEGPASSARFELFPDRAGEWRWRLRHDNGNIIATGGEGYTRKHNAKKGLRSVVTNAPRAPVVEVGEGE